MLRIQKKLNGGGIENKLKRQKLKKNQKERKKRNILYKGKVHLAQWLISIMIPCPPLHATNR